MQSMGSQRVRPEWATEQQQSHWVMRWLVIQQQLTDTARKSGSSSLLSLIIHHFFSPNVPHCSPWSFSPQPFSRQPFSFYYSSFKACKSHCMWTCRSPLRIENGIWIHMKRHFFFQWEAYHAGANCVCTVGWLNMPRRSVSTFHHSMLINRKLRNGVCSPLGTEQPRARGFPVSCLKAERRWEAARLSWCTQIAGRTCLLLPSRWISSWGGHRNGSVAIRRKPALVNRIASLPQTAISHWAVGPSTRCHCQGQL